jgi:hypothetical protein
MWRTSEETGRIDPSGSTWRARIPLRIWRRLSAWARPWASAIASARFENQSVIARMIVSPT